jgi:hypothetical protein
MMLPAAVGKDPWVVNFMGILAPGLSLSLREFESLRYANFLFADQLVRNLFRPVAGTCPVPSDSQT